MLLLIMVVNPSQSANGNMEVSAMFDWIIDVMEWIAGLIILGVIIYTIIDSIIYLTYRGKDKDEDI